MPEIFLPLYSILNFFELVLVLILRASKHTEIHMYGKLFIISCEEIGACIVLSKRSMEKDSKTYLCTYVLYILSYG